jgi:hypothetical protein
MNTLTADAVTALLTHLADHDAANLLLSRHLTQTTQKAQSNSYWRDRVLQHTLLTPPYSEAR